MAAFGVGVGQTRDRGGNPMGGVGVLVAHDLQEKFERRLPRRNDLAAQTPSGSSSAALGAAAAPGIAQLRNARAHCDPPSSDLPSLPAYFAENRL